MNCSGHSSTGAIEWKTKSYASRRSFRRSRRDWRSWSILRRSKLLSLLILVLQLIQLPINPSQRQELLMVARLAELAFMHHQNSVGALDCGQSVRDHDRRASFHHSGQRLAYAQLGLRVHAGG